MADACAQLIGALFNYARSLGATAFRWFRREPASVAACQLVATGRGPLHLAARSGPPPPRSGSHFLGRAYLNLACSNQAPTGQAGWLLAWWLGIPWHLASHKVICAIFFTATHCFLLFPFVLLILPEVARVSETASCCLAGRDPSRGSPARPTAPAGLGSGAPGPLSGA